MKINAEGLNIIKHFEGFSPTVYLCPANRWTIGYGSTWDKQRKPVTKSHPPITEEDGEDLEKLSINAEKVSLLFEKNMRNHYSDNDQLLDF